MTSLQDALDRYLTLRRALGYKLECEGRELPKFLAYVQAQGSSVLTTRLALDWATRPAGASARYHAGRLSRVRRFAEYLRALDARTEVPPQGLIPSRKSRATPYLYTPQELRLLLEAAADHGGPLRGHTFATLFGLVAATGLRLGEAIALQCRDVDIHHRLLVVHGGKFGKSREVALHPTTLEALKAYARWRDRVLPRPRSSCFFLSPRGFRLYKSDVHVAWGLLVQKLGLGRGRPSQPRIHDLRHSFAVKTLLDWYRRGLDVEARLPLLSVYLGHVSPSSTYWYLSAAPELLALAGERLERSFSFGGQP